MKIISGDKFVFTYMGRTYSGVSTQQIAVYGGFRMLLLSLEPDNPAIARIEDMDLKPMPIFVLFVFIFPGIGLSFSFLRSGRGYRKFMLSGTGL
jgi:hypothetical protein